MWEKKKKTCGRRRKRMGKEKKPLKKRKTVGKEENHGKNKEIRVKAQEVCGVRCAVEEVVG